MLKKSAKLTTSLFNRKYTKKPTIEYVSSPKAPKAVGPYRYFF